MGEDCSKVMVIDESRKELTLRDERLEEAVRETGAGLIVLDPLQAYLGDGVDMHRANEVRPVFKKLCAMAERTGCAVILIGHMNKMQGAKSSYRGLGSIDFQAAARSVLLVGRLRDEPANHSNAIKYANTRKGYWRIANSPILKVTVTDALLRKAGYTFF